MKELFCEAGDYGSGFRGDYDTIVESFGYEVMFAVSTGDYQGTIYYLLRDGTRFGTLDVGYGSCSGCDSLAACETPNQVIELQRDIFAGIKWYESSRGLVEDLLAQELSSYYERDETKVFLKHLPRIEFSAHTRTAIRDVDFSVEILNDMLIEDGYNNIAAALRMKPQSVLIRLREYLCSTD